MNHGDEIAIFSSKQRLHRACAAPSLSAARREVRFVVAHMSGRNWVGLMSHHGQTLHQLLLFGDFCNRDWILPLVQHHSSEHCARAGPCCEHSTRVGANARLPRESRKTFLAKRVSRLVP